MVTYRSCECMGLGYRGATATANFRFFVQVHLRLILCPLGQFIVPHMGSALQITMHAKRVSVA